CWLGTLLRFTARCSSPAPFECPARCAQFLCPSRELFAPVAGAESCVSEWVLLHLRSCQCRGLLSHYERALRETRATIRWRRLASCSFCYSLSLRCSLSGSGRKMPRRSRFPLG